MFCSLDSYSTAVLSFGVRQKNPGSLACPEYWKIHHTCFQSKNRHLEYLPDTYPPGQHAVWSSLDAKSFANPETCRLHMQYIPSRIKTNGKRPDQHEKIRTPKDKYTPENGKGTASSTARYTNVLRERLEWQAIIVRSIVISSQGMEAVVSTAMQHSDSRNNNHSLRRRRLFSRATMVEEIRNSGPLLSHSSSRRSLLLLSILSKAFGIPLEVRLS